MYSAGFEFYKIFLLWASVSTITKSLILRERRVDCVWRVDDTHTLHANLLGAAAELL